MAGRAEQEESALLYLPTTTILLARAPAFAMDAICELHDKIRSNEIQIIDGTYSTRALRLLLFK